MILRDIRPHQSLRDYIQCYRICHFEFNNADNIPVKAWAPKPENILHFFLRDYWAVQRPGEKKNEQPSIVLVGQRTSLVRQFTGANFLNVHIVFQPTAVYQLTGIPAYELTNQHLDASLVFNTGLKTTQNKLLEAKDYEEMLHIIEDFSFQIVRQSRHQARPLDKVTRLMINHGGNISVDALADDSCLCTKQFKRKFFEQVGVNPKTYSKIIRFNKSYNLRNAYPQRDWLDIAVQCKYYDYQHLVKDYKEFTGLTPNEYHRLEGRAPERILGLTDSLYQDRAAAYMR